MAKDILRLHGIVWPAMLLAAGYQPPHGLFVHGYFTSGGQKMSKTLGNVIDPFEVIERLGADALRFYLLREVQWGQDGDVTWEGIQRRYEGELANDLGNLVSRARRWSSATATARPRGGERAEPVHEQVGARLADFDLTGALEEIWGLVRTANRFVEERQPWALARATTRADAKRLDETLYTLVDTVRALAVLLHPVIPAAAAKILQAVGEPGAVRWDRAALGGLAAGTAIAQPDSCSRASRGRMIDTHAHLEMCEGPAEEVVAAGGGGRVPDRHHRPRPGGGAGGAAPRAWAVVGFHPHEAGEADVEELRPLLGHPRVVALGECGLDYYRDYAPRDAQRRLFEAQIELAQEAGLPLVIHTRDAGDDTFAMLEDVAVRRGAALLLDRRAAGGGGGAGLVLLVRRERHLPGARRAARGGAAGAGRPPAGRDRLAVPGAGAAARPSQQPANVMLTLGCWRRSAASNRRSWPRRSTATPTACSACGERRGAAAGAGRRGHPRRLERDPRRLARPGLGDRRAVADGAGRRRPVRRRVVEPGVRGRAVHRRLGGVRAGLHRAPRDGVRARRRQRRLPDRPWLGAAVRAGRGRGAQRRRGARRRPGGLRRDRRARRPPPPARASTSAWHWPSASRSPGTR